MVHRGNLSHLLLPVMERGFSLFIVIYVLLLYSAYGDYVNQITKGRTIHIEYKRGTYDL